MSLFNLIPFPYRILIIALLCGGLFSFGYLKGLDHSKQVEAKYVAELNKKLTEAQIKINKNNDIVVTKYVDKVVTITKKEYVYVNLANSVVPSEHFMSTGWVQLHNVSATNGDSSNSTVYSNATPTTTKDNTALATVVENYGICERNSEQLRTLQEWLLTTKKTLEGKM